MNSAWIIEQALSSLYSQTFTDFDLYVVDSGSTDQTIEIVKEFPCSLKQIEPSSYYPGAVLNMGIEGIDADIIVFQNSDVVLLSPESLENLLNSFSDPEIHAAFARQVPRPEAKAWVKRDYESSFPNSPTPPEWIVLSLPFAAMRKSTWKRHHFYADAWASEDTEWGVWAQKTELGIKYVHDSLVMHSHNYTLSQIYGRKFVEGEADAFIYHNRTSIVKTIKRFIASSIKDFIGYVNCRDFLGIFSVPVRRFVYNWAYYKGHKHGEKRLKSGNIDASDGQKNVLSRYG